MGFLTKPANLRLLLIGCFFCAIISSAFWNFRTSAQTQTAATPAASPSPTVSPTVTPTSSPTPIPAPSIVDERERTEKRLEQINRKIFDRTVASQIEKDFSELVKDANERQRETDEAIGAGASLEKLDRMESYWASISLLLPSQKSRLEARIAEINAQLTELQNTLAVWNLTKQSIENSATQTAAEAAPDGNSANANFAANSNANANRNANVNPNANTNRNANFNLNANLNANSNSNAANFAQAEPAPTPVLELSENLKERINETIEKIGVTEKALRTNLGELIKLQERFAENQKRAEQMLTKIGAAKDDLLFGLVVRNAPPIWSAESFRGEFRQEVGKSFVEEFTELRDYAAEHRGLFLVHLVIVLVLIFAFRRARRKTRQLVALEPELKAGLIIFEYPLASALILGFFLLPLIYFQAPELLGVIASPVLVVSVFFLLRGLIEKPFVPILVAVVALYLVNDLRIFTEPVPLLSRIIFLAQTLGGIVFLAWLIRANRRSTNAATTDFGYAKIIRTVAIILLIPFGVVFLANVFGFTNLAGVVGKALVSSLGVGLILYALVRVADSLLIFLFRIPPFSKLRMVSGHRALVRAKIFKIIKWLAILIWLLITLSQTYFLTPVTSALNRILTYRVGDEEIGFSPADVLAFALIIWLTFLLSRFLRFALEEDVYPRVHLASGLPYAASTILHYFLLVVGVLLAFAATGIDLTKFTIFFGALGVGVGIGLQKIVENFTSGIILLLERPVKVGDSIQTNEHQGLLRKIGLRASVVETFEGAEIIVPNGQLITQEVTNWTLTDSHRRLDINVGVEYGADPETVIELLEAVGNAHPHTSPDFAPRALFIGFGDNALNFQLRVWTANRDVWVVMKSDLTVGVYRALKQADIVIPFPQRDLHLKSVDADLLMNINSIRNKNVEDDSVK